MPVDSISADASTNTTSAMPSAVAIVVVRTNEQTANVVADRNHRVLASADAAQGVDDLELGGAIRRNRCREQTADQGERQRRRRQRRLHAEVRENRAHVLFQETPEPAFDQRIREPDAERRPSSPTTIASPTTNNTMCFGRKPIARSTPYSPVRSRTPMAMVLPRINIMISTITTDTTSIARKMADSMPRNDACIARSLMLSVWMSRSEKRWSMARQISAERPGSAIRATTQPT